MTRCPSDRAGTCWALIRLPQSLCECQQQQAEARTCMSTHVWHTHRQTSNASHIMCSSESSQHSRTTSFMKAHLVRTHTAQCWTTLAVRSGRHCLCSASTAPRCRQDSRFLGRTARRLLFPRRCWDLRRIRVGNLLWFHQTAHTHTVDMHLCHVVKPSLNMCLVPTQLPSSVSGSQQSTHTCTQLS